MKKQISMTTVFLFLVLFTIFTVAPFILAHFDVEISSAVNNYNAENVREEDQSSSDFMNDLPTIYETIPYTGYPLIPFRSKGVAKTLSSSTGNSGYYIQFRINEDGDWREQNDYMYLVEMGSYDIYFRTYYIDYDGNTVYYQPVKIGTTTVTIGKAVPTKGWLGSMGPITYDGEEHVLFYGKASSLPKVGTIYYYAHTSGTYAPYITGTPIQDVFETDIDNLKKADEGTYYLWCWIEGNEYFEASDITYMGISTTIAKPTGSLKTGTLQASNSIEPYNGSKQQLFTGEAIGPDECLNHCILYYASTTEPHPNKIGYLNIADIKETDAGEYMLYYRMHSCDNYADIPWTPTGITATIERALPVFEKGTIEGADTSYTGSNISVFNGTGNITTGEGTIYYYCTSGEQPDDSVIGYENIQAVTAKTPGTYTLWYRIEGTNYEVGWTHAGVEAVITKRDSMPTSKSIIDFVPLMVVVGFALVLFLVCSKLGKRAS